MASSKAAVLWTELAGQVDRLAKPASVGAVFRQRVREAADERQKVYFRWIEEKSEIPSDHYPLPVPKRQVSLGEKYAALAAIRDAHWRGVGDTLGPLSEDMADAESREAAEAVRRKNVDLELGSLSHSGAEERDAERAATEAASRVQNISTWYRELVKKAKRLGTRSVPIPSMGATPARQQGKTKRLGTRSLPILRAWLADVEADLGSGKPAEADQGARDVTPTPVQYLISWREILIALGVKNNKEDQAKVRNLNKNFAGPIITPKQGAQPKVDRAKLIEWWNGLEQKFRDSGQRRESTDATVAGQHRYPKLRTSQKIRAIFPGSRPVS